MLGKPVFSGCNLTDFGIQQGSTVTMIRRLCGGMPVVSDGSALELEGNPVDPDLCLGGHCLFVDRSVSLRWHPTLCRRTAASKSVLSDEFLAPKTVGKRSRVDVS